MAALIGRVQPRNADAVSFLESANAHAESVHGADNLVAGNKRKLWKGEVAFDGMQVSVANGAAADADANLSRIGDWVREFGKLERRFVYRARGLKLHGAHGNILGHGRKVDAVAAEHDVGYRCRMNNLEDLSCLFSGWVMHNWVQVAGTPSEKSGMLCVEAEGMWKDAEVNRPAWDKMRTLLSDFLTEKVSTPSPDSLEYAEPKNYSSEVPSVALSLDNYLSAVKRFNESVSEIAGKLEQLNLARAEALKASEELKKELETTDRQMQEVAAGLGQQISAQTGVKKSVQTEEAIQSAAVRRAS